MQELFIKKYITVIILVLLTSFAFGQMQLARLHYSGGGDWYNDPEVLPNLAEYANKELNTSFAGNEKVVKLTDAELLDFPFIYMTGHGNVKFSTREIENLKKYLLSGGMLYCDDDYGLDKSFRNEIKKVFPDRELVELPKEHDLFNCYFNFSQGTPKIHEHDKKRPQTFAIFDDFGRIMVLYTYETNISDGWADYSTHKDSDQTREKALKFGTNILYYLLTK